MTTSTREVRETRLARGLDFIITGTFLGARGGGVRVGGVWTVAGEERGEQVMGERETHRRWRDLCSNRGLVIDEGGGQQPAGGM